MEVYGWVFYGGKFYPKNERNATITEVGWVVIERADKSQVVKVRYEIRHDAIVYALSFG